MRALLLPLGGAAPKWVPLLSIFLLLRAKGNDQESEDTLPFEASCSYLQRALTVPSLNALHKSQFKDYKELPFMRTDTSPWHYDEPEYGYCPSTAVPLWEGTARASKLLAKRAYKITIAASSPEEGMEIQAAMWLGMNHVVRKRSLPVSHYPPYVGPTSCSQRDPASGSLETRFWRAWTAAAYEVEMNDFHIVYSKDFETSIFSPAANLSLSVVEYNTMLRRAHGDLISTRNSFLDNRLTWGAYYVDSFVHGVRDLTDQLGWPHALLRGRTWTGEPVFVARTLAANGNIFDTVAPFVQDSALSKMFHEDPCLIFPDSLITDLMLLAPENLDPEESFGGFCKESMPLVRCSNLTVEDTSGSPKAQSVYDFAVAERMQNGVPENTTLRFPWHNPSRILIQHVASTDPATDADFLLKYYVAEDITERNVHQSQQESTCAEVFPSQANGTSRWVMFKTGESYSRPHGAAGWQTFRTGNTFYVHLSYHPNAPPLETASGRKITLKDLVRFLGDAHVSMRANSYDAFLENSRLGIMIDQAARPDAILQMDKDGVPLLTRREVKEDDPLIANGPSALRYLKNYSGSIDPGEHVYCYEAWSVFFVLPESRFAVQSLLFNWREEWAREAGLPIFCDWTFCNGSFANFRGEDNLWDPTECGFTMSNWSNLL